MASLQIYIHASGDCVLHRSGFSLFAATLLPIWAVRRRMYKTALVTAAVGIACSELANRLIEGFASETTQGVVALAYLGAWFFAAGLFATRWHRHVLERAGYVAVAIDSPPPPAQARA